MIDELLEHVPPEFHERLTSIVALTDPFCDEHLNDEYKVLCAEMAACICQEGSPVLRGKALSWAGGIIHTVGWVNFLTDPGHSPHMTTAQLAEAIGVSVSTLMSKSKAIREGLDLMPFDPNWCLPSRLDDNPILMAANMMEAATGQPMSEEDLKRILLDPLKLPDDLDSGAGGVDDGTDDDDDMTGRGVVGRIGF